MLWMVDAYIFFWNYSPEWETHLWFMFICNTHLYFIGKCIRLHELHFHLYTHFWVTRLKIDEYYIVQLWKRPSRIISWRFAKPRRSAAVGTVNDARNCWREKSSWSQSAPNWREYDHSRCSVYILYYACPRVLNQMLIFVLILSAVKTQCAISV